MRRLRTGEGGRGGKRGRVSEWRLYAVSATQAIFTARTCIVLHKNYKPFHIGVYIAAD